MKTWYREANVERTTTSFFQKGRMPAWPESWHNFQKMRVNVHILCLYDLITGLCLWDPIFCLLLNLFYLKGFFLSFLVVLLVELLELSDEIIDRIFPIPSTFQPEFSSVFVSLTEFCFQILVSFSFSSAYVCVFRVVLRYLFPLCPFMSSLNSLNALMKLMIVLSRSVP